MVILVKEFRFKTEKEDDFIREEYEEYLRSHLSGTELRVWLRHALREDMPMKLSSQFGILRKVGFRIVRVKWKFVNEAVYIARK